VPAENRLRPDQQSCPGRSGKALAKGGHDHPIARTPAHPLDLSLQNLRLAAQGQHLALKLGSSARLVATTSSTKRTSE